MNQMVNLVPPGEPLDYDRRIALLRERKLAETQVKSKIAVYQDGDDYGSVPAPEEYKFTPIPNHESGTWFGYEGWSKNFYKLMDEHPVYIDPADAFTCRWMFSMIWFPEKQKDKRWNPAYPFDHLKERQKLYGIVPGIGSDAHFGGDYEIGFKLGWGGLLDKIEKYRAINPGRDEFYDAEALVIRGVQQWMTHAAEEAERLAALEKHPRLRENLLEMAKVNRSILFGAPQTLREACQWACWFNMVSRTYNRDGAGFQLDTLLRGFYEKDLAAGRITRDEAVFYLACLLLNDPHYYQIGGLDGDDNDLLSEFSYMVLEAADKLNSTCNITVRVHKDIDRAFMRKAVGYLFEHKNAWPRFSGEEALNGGFMRMGYPKELARKRIAVGCHWMSLPGLEYTLNDCVKINAAKVFEVALDEMLAAGGSYSTERLWEIYDG
ncbi:MAG: pyruvate formate lyase family protein, partial [Clostridiales bacterium]|nr:pyruvate formate lyase family protein [Clostridiales bacterium]